MVDQQHSEKKRNLNDQNEVISSPRQVGREFASLVEGYSEGNHQKTPSTLNCAELSDQLAPLFEFSFANSPGLLND